MEMKIFGALEGVLLTSPSRCFDLMWEKGMYGNEGGRLERELFIYWLGTEEILEKPAQGMRPWASKLCGVRGGPSWPPPPPLLSQPKATGHSLPVSSLAFLINWDWDQFVDAFGALKQCLSHLP